MKYFTRDLIDRMHDDNLPLLAWTNVVRQYRNRCRKLLHILPANVRRLTTTSFHDCKVQSISFSKRNRLDIVLYGHRYYRYSKRSIPGVHHLIFTGVTNAIITFTTLNDWWLYEEVDITKGSPEYRVILDRTEIWIRFERFRLETNTQHSSAGDAANRAAGAK